MTVETHASAAVRTPWRARLAAFRDSDLVYSFLASRVTIAAAAVTVVIMLAALLAPVIATQDPYDLRQLSLLTAQSAGLGAGGDRRFLLGTDDQGRDVFSTILYGSRQSIAIGVMSMLFAALLGIALGLIAGGRRRRGGFDHRHAHRRHPEPRSRRS